MKSRTKPYLFGYSTQRVFWGFVFCVACKSGIGPLISVATEKRISIIGHPKMGLIDSSWLIWPIIFRRIFQLWNERKR